MRYKIPIDILELELDNYHPVVSTVFADGSEGKWVIDSGASKSVFNMQLEEQVASVDQFTEDLHSAGINDQPMKSSLGYLKSFSIGGLKVEHMKVALIDLSHINTLYAKTTNLEICGLLGSDFLVRYNAVIDYRKKRMVLKVQRKNIL